jgi:(p)ppGpp synthase/HD superfamily hydrolase
MPAPTVILGPRFERALVHAARWHRLQARKSTYTPYLGHLLGVCDLVMAAGGDEDECIAALLHDAVEDQGGSLRLDEIRQEFGARVAAVVAEVTEPGTTDLAGARKAPWEDRKRGYLDRVAAGTPAAVLVSICDKTYNLRSMIDNVAEHGEAGWSVYTGGPARQLWFYRSLATIYDERIPGRMAERFRALVDDLAALMPPGGVPDPRRVAGADPSAQRSAVVSLVPSPVPAMAPGAGAPPEDHAG